MTRTNLVLDEKLLAAAQCVAGAGTYSATVNHALAELVRINQLRGLDDWTGSGVWEGDLAAMREDKPRIPQGRRPRRRK